MCGKVLKSIHSMKSHMRFMHSEKDSVCPECGVKVNSKLLNTHIYEKHTIKTCNTCGKQMTRSKYKDHIRLHKNIKAYACKICNKKFINSSTAIKHLYSHGKARALNCHIFNCGFGTATVPALKTHYRKKHELIKTFDEVKEVMVRKDPEHDKSNIIKLASESQVREVVEPKSSDSEHE